MAHHQTVLNHTDVNIVTQAIKMVSSLTVVRSVKLGILVPTNLVGNFLVVMVIKRSKRSLRSPMNYLLANLAIADITVAIFMVMDQIFFHAVHHPAGVAGDYLCKLLTGKNLTWVGSVASVCTLLAIAFERFYAIVLPYHNRSRGRMTNKKICLIVVFCWTFALLFNAPLFAVRKFNHDQAETGFLCRSYWPNKELAIAYNYLWVIFIGVIPTSLMFFFYGRIVHNLWFNQSNVTDEAQKARLRARKRVTKILMTLNLIYALCWFPNLLLNVISYYVNIPSLHSIGYLVSEMLVLLNSSINPFVYTLQSKQFRQAIKNIVCWRRSIVVTPLATVGTQIDSTTATTNYTR